MFIELLGRDLFRVAGYEFGGDMASVRKMVKSDIMHVGNEIFALRTSTAIDTLQSITLRSVTGSRYDILACDIKIGEANIDHNGFISTDINFEHAEVISSVRKQLIELFNEIYACRVAYLRHQINCIPQKCDTVTYGNMLFKHVARAACGIPGYMIYMWHVPQFNAQRFYTISTTIGVVNVYRGGSYAYALVKTDGSKESDDFETLHPMLLNNIMGEMQHISLEDDIIIYRGTEFGKVTESGMIEVSSAHRYLSPFIAHKLNLNIN